MRRLSRVASRQVFAFSMTEFNTLTTLLICRAKVTVDGVRGRKPPRDWAQEAMQSFDTSEADRKRRHIQVEERRVPPGKSEIFDSF
jgi:hypothetical protein